MMVVEYSVVLIMYAIIYLLSVHKGTSLKGRVGHELANN